MLKTQTKTNPTQIPNFVRLVNGSSVMAVVGSISWCDAEGVWIGSDVDTDDRWLLWDIEGDIAISYRRA